MADSSIKITRGGNGEEDKGYLVRWKQRQRMAWVSLWFMLGFTMVEWMILPPYFKYMDIPTSEWTTLISSTSDWMYITLGSVILGYMGSTAYMLKGRNIQVKDKDY
jgi:Na+-driven multidrug efflux pump